MDDSEQVWLWRAGLPPDHFRAGRNPPLPDHLGWWARTLQSPARHLLMANGAHLRLDGTGTHAAVSILLGPRARGRGLGLRLLHLGAAHARRAGLRTLVASVATHNAASCQLFRKAGYRETAAEAGFVDFSLAIGPEPRQDTP